MRTSTLFTLLAVSTFSVSAARADGIISQLPKDGAWVRFEIKGQGVAADGTVGTTVEGTQTISSVGRATIDKEPCRWIELKSEMKFKSKGREGKLSEILKLLIPEKYLTKGQNPVKHVVKAFKKDSKGTVRELDLKGKGGREIRRLDEVFHPPLKNVAKLKPATIEGKLGKLECEGSKAHTVDDNGTVFTTETRFHKKAPFGVVAYQYEKERMKDGQSNGKRSMKWKLVDFGTNAKSAVPGS